MHTLSPLDALPRDVFLLVSRFLAGFELLALSHVNRRHFRDLLAADGVAWRSRMTSKRFASSDVWRAKTQTNASIKPRWKTKYKRLLGDLKDVVKPKRTSLITQRTKRPSYKELYFTSLSLRFIVSTSDGGRRDRRVGSAVALGDAVRSTWNAAAFSFDLWFALLPPSSKGVNAPSYAVLLGAQTSEWPRLDLVDGSSQQFVYVDRERHLHVSMTTESPSLGQRLEYERWYHVALSFRRSSDDWRKGEQRVYVDGELVQVSEGVIHPKWRFLNYAQLGSGCMDLPHQVGDGNTAEPVGGSARWYGFNGVVDACRFWSGALSDAQVQLLQQGEEDQVVGAGMKCAWSLKQDADTVFYGSSYQFVCSSRPRERRYYEL